MIKGNPLYNFTSSKQAIPADLKKQQLYIQQRLLLCYAVYFYSNCKYLQILQMSSTLRCTSGAPEVDGVFVFQHLPNKCICEFEIDS